LSVQLSFKCNFSLTVELILIKGYTVAIYDLRMGMRKDNPGPKWR